VVHYVVNGQTSQAETFQLAGAVEAPAKSNGPGRLRCPRSQDLLDAWVPPTKFGGHLKHVDDDFQL
jgi:hypothetical protein